MLISHDCSGDTDQRQSDGIIGGTFVINYMVSGITNLAGDLLMRFIRVASEAGAAILLYGDACEVRHAPRGHFAVAVLAEDVGVDVPGVDATVAAEHITESCTVEDCA